MRVAYVQSQLREIRSVLNDALDECGLVCVETEPKDVRNLALAVIELSAARDGSSQLPAWLRVAHVPSVAIAVTSSEDLAIWSLRQGFREYLRTPLQAADVRAALSRLVAPSLPTSSASLPQIVGRSQAMRTLFDQVWTVAQARTNVLIVGETGTGKELIAQSIHEASPRRSRPLVAVNCGAIPDGLIESELFGHERGAFTDAHLSRPGRVRQSDGGTLFLDEVGELDLRAQVKLLRVLETREVHALGAGQARRLDIRVVAATNQNLAARVRDKAFREDLFYRLNVVQIEVPPLRERSEDIPLLIAAFCGRFCHEFNRRSAVYAEGDLDLLQRYDWPGNVRELRNVVEASFVHSSGRSDGLLVLPPVLLRVLDKERTLDERGQIVRALFEAHWNVSRAAHRLNCSRMTLYRRMIQYQLRRPPSHPPGNIPTCHGDSRL
jgi:DNA-binding NtrC family response regulator